jgi:hypothetical protein
VEIRAAHAALLISPPTQVKMPFKSFIDSKGIKVESNDIITWNSITQKQ